jgi:hypothetical protein
MSEQASHPSAYPARSEAAKEILPAGEPFPARAFRLLVSFPSVWHTWIASMSLTSSGFLVVFIFFSLPQEVNFVSPSFSCFSPLFPLVMDFEN